MESPSTMSSSSSRPSPPPERSLPPPRLVSPPRVPLLGLWAIWSYPVYQNRPGSVNRSCAGKLLTLFPFVVLPQCHPPHHLPSSFPPPLKILYGFQTQGLHRRPTLPFRRMFPAVQAQPIPNHPMSRRQTPLLPPTLCPPYYHSRRFRTLL